MRSLELAEATPVAAAVALVVLLGCVLAGAISCWIKSERRATRLSAQLDKTREELGFWYSQWRTLATTTAVTTPQNRSVNSPALTPAGDPSAAALRPMDGAKTQKLPPHAALTHIWRSRKPAP